MHKLAAAVLTLGALTAQDPKQTVEYGTVDWQRDLDGAFATAEKTGKPVLLLFQEVPG